MRAYAVYLHLLRLLDEARDEIARLTQERDDYRSDYHRVHKDKMDLIDARLRAAPPGASRWRHKKRSTTYQIVGEAQAQVVGAPVEEGSIVVVYRSEQDNSLWIRPKHEFHDGRFEQLSSTSIPPGASAMERANNLRCAAGSVNEGKLLLKPWQTVPVARAIEQAEREARAAAIKEAAQIADLEAARCKSTERPPWTPEIQRAGRVTAEAIATFVRALADPAPQEIPL